MHGFCAACHGLPHPLRRSPTYLIQIPNRLYRDFAIERRNKLCLPPIDFSAAACPGVISWAGWPWSRAARPWLWPAVPRPRPSLPPPPPRHRRRAYCSAHAWRHRLARIHRSRFDRVRRRRRDPAGVPVQTHTPRTPSRHRRGAREPGSAAPLPRNQAPVRA